MMTKSYITGEGKEEDRSALPFPFPFQSPQLIMNNIFHGALL